MHYSSNTFPGFIYGRDYKSVVLQVESLQKLIVISKQVDTRAIEIYGNEDLAFNIYSDTGLSNVHPIEALRNQAQH
eukprot:Awhi_evm1s15119